MTKHLKEASEPARVSQLMSLQHMELQSEPEPEQEREKMANTIMRAESSQQPFVCVRHWADHHTNIVHFITAAH
jgi:hypothetical protein